MTSETNVEDVNGDGDGGNKTSQEQRSATQLPEPKGYRILCAVPEAKEEYDSGLIKASDTRRIEENATVVLFVIKLGAMCYKDENKFPTGPWCKEGDFVLTRAYAGTRIIS